MTVTAYTAQGMPRQRATVAIKANGKVGSTVTSGDHNKWILSTAKVTVNVSHRQRHSQSPSVTVAVRVTGIPATHQENNRQTSISTNPPHSYVGSQQHCSSIRSRRQLTSSSIVVHVKGVKHGVSVDDLSIVAAADEHVDRASISCSEERVASERQPTEVIQETAQRGLRMRCKRYDTQATRALAKHATQAAQAAQAT